MYVYISHGWRFIAQKSNHRGNLTVVPSVSEGLGQFPRRLISVLINQSAMRYSLYMPVAIISIALYGLFFGYKPVQEKSVFARFIAKKETTKNNRNNCYRYI